MSASEPGPGLLDEIRSNGPVPAHVAIIMDGNGRWARERGLPRWEGHRRGMGAVEESVEGCLETGVGHLTLFAFSRENWARPEEEVDALMDLLEEFVAKKKEELRENGVRVRAFGELQQLPAAGRAALDELQAHTRDADALQLHLAISYGSRTEIVSAARKVAELVQLGVLEPAEIDEEAFSRELYTSGCPDPDLLIRTSGERRLSNFLLWQIAYTELYVAPVLWPDFRRLDLFRAIRDYQGRERRFGRVTS